MAKICLVLTASTIEENKTILERNRSHIEMAELRTDLLRNDQYEKVAPFSVAAGLPLILTCRKPEDGGRWDGSEEERRSLLNQWLEGGFSYIDLEIGLIDEALVKKARDRNVKIIRSFHDFEGVPSDLEVRMNSHAEAITKGAVYPRSSGELHRLIETALSLKKKRKSPFILLGMGDYGFPTRILAEKLGSYLTFCSDSEAPSGAPGHCSASDLNEIYHFRKIGEKTIINTIIGNPVSQSKSPHIHNGGYVEKGMDAVYVPFLTDSPEWFMKIAGLLDINGSSVTVPFKSDIIPLVDQADGAVKAIGASNTIYRDRTGRWLATNTDTYGLVKPLLDLLDTDSLAGRKIAVIGAGGAARAAVFALMDKGADVAVFNRTRERADVLATQLGCRAFGLNEEFADNLKEYSSVIVQTSSAGMPPLEEVDPLSFYSFDGSEVVYDIIYKPNVTKLMERAGKAGCAVLGGYRMLEEQAALQFEIFSREA